MSKLGIPLLYRLDAPILLKSLFEYPIYLWNLPLYGREASLFAFREGSETWMQAFMH